jgi:hypothetical protein
MQKRKQKNNLLLQEREKKLLARTCSEVKDHFGPLKISRFRREEESASVA